MRSSSRVVMASARRRRASDRPRSVSVASSLEKAPDVKQAAAEDDDDKPEPAKATASAAEKPSTSDAPAAVQPVVDEVIFTEEIIIDIDDE